MSSGGEFPVTVRRMSPEGESPVTVRLAYGYADAPGSSGEQDAVPAGLDGSEIPTARKRPFNLFRHSP